jgi:hypothetical protein
MERDIPLPIPQPTSAPNNIAAAAAPNLIGQAGCAQKTALEMAGIPTSDAQRTANRPGVQFCFRPSFDPIHAPMQADAIAPAKLPPNHNARTLSAESMPSPTICLFNQSMTSSEIRALTSKPIIPKYAVPQSPPQRPAREITLKFVIA